VEEGKQDQFHVHFADEGIISATGRATHTLYMGMSDTQGTNPDGTLKEWTSLAVTKSILSRYGAEEDPYVLEGQKVQITFKQGKGDHSPSWSLMGDSRDDDESLVAIAKTRFSRMK